MLVWPSTAATSSTETPRPFGPTSSPKLRPLVVNECRSCPGSRGNSAEFLCETADLRPPLVLCVGEENSAEYAKEVSALDPELVFRDVPGKSVQRPPHPKRLR